ncbi:MAG: flagellar assembly protein FliW [Gemmatimonadetes bacterium]|nr:flagellar assembly protein FliW [Gemmatimonadota bacterium]
MPSIPGSFSLSTGDTEIRSRVFGTLKVAADQRITMPEGLIGFPACHDFALVPAGPRGFSWLQSMEHETLALLLVDPFLYFPGYSIDLPDAMTARLGAAQSASVSVHAVVTLAESDNSATANLQGPLLFNVESRRGFQFVMQSAPFGTREKIEL